MNYFNRLDQINSEIEMINEHIQHLVKGKEDIIALNEIYAQQSEAMTDAQKESLNSFATEFVIREELHGLERKKLKLITERDDIIKKVIFASRFSVNEVIDILDRFECYYKAERIGVRTFLVPQDLCLMRAGYNSVIEEEALNKLLAEYNYGENVKKSAYSMQLYVKTPNGVKENKQTLTVVAGLEVNDMEGIQVYQRTGNTISLNKRVVNLFPYDVLAFIDYLIVGRLDKPRLTLEEAWKEYNGIDNKVLSFSKDDPALEDIYRKTR